MVEGPDNYHLRELRCSAQCHTQKMMWIIERSDESIILCLVGIEYLEICMEHKFSTSFFQHQCKLKSQERGILLQFQVWYIEFTPSVVTSNSLQRGWCITSTTWGKRYLDTFEYALFELPGGSVVRIIIQVYYKDDSCRSADLKSKTTEDIISIGSFMEVLVLI
ncbi:hypothetical protein Tco_0506064 [Tanacetum coccineum]